MLSVGTARPTAAKASASSPQLFPKVFFGDAHCRFSKPEKPSHSLEKRLFSRNEYTAKRLTDLGREGAKRL